MTSELRLSPSGANGWWHCPGKPAAEAGLPDDENEWAAEGKMAHSISDTCLVTGLTPYDFVGVRMQVGQWSFEWDEDAAELLVYRLNDLLRLDGRIFSELRVDLSPWLGEGRGGTLDRAVVCDDVIVICDLKWGYDPVSPVENKQLCLYALGFWNDVARHITKATEFLIIVDQPRTPAGGGLWRISLGDLLAFGEEAKVRAAAALAPGAPRAGGPHCVNCRRFKARGGCFEADRYCMEEVLEMPGEIIDRNDAVCAPPLTPNILDPARRSFIIRHAKLLKAWIDQQAEEGLAAALEGNPPPELKAVHGNRPARKWADAETADAALAALVGDARLTAPKLKSPTQIEKDVGKDVYAEKVAHLVDHAEPKPILVPVADARIALTPMTNQFDDLPETTSSEGTK